MKYRKLPANIASHRPRMFGLDYNALLILVVTALASISLVEIDPYLSILIVSVGLLLSIGRYQGSTIYELMFRRLGRIGMRSRQRIPYDMTTEDSGEFRLIHYKGRIFIIAEIKGIPIMELRINEQRALLARIRDLVRESNLKITFHTYLGGIFSGSTDSIFLSISSRESDSGGNSDRGIVKDAMRLRSGFISLGFGFESVSSTYLKSAIGLFLGQDRSQDLEEITLDYGKRFLRKPVNALFLKLSDSSSEEAPYTFSFLEGSGAKSIVHLSVERITDDDAMKLLSGARTSRRAELEMNGDRMGKSHLSISGEINAIREMEEGIKENQDPLVDVSMTVSIIARHPADLPEIEQKFLSAFSYLGMRFQRELPDRNSASHIFPFIAEKRSPYYMNASAVAALFPIFLNQYNSRGILIGFNDLNGKANYLDIVEGRGNNFLVIGETGSGKSFFSRAVIQRLQNSNIIEGIYIFDPLNEYSEEDFGSEARSKKAKILRRENDVEFEKYVGDSISALNAAMVSDTKWKVILMEECHIFLSSDKWRKALETMVRHSRHYNTIIMNVSQNVDDFLKTANASIALNSNHIFLFRTRKLGEADLLPLKLDGFDGIRPAALVGGSGFPYSECYHSDGKYCRKLRIIE